MKKRIAPLFGANNPEAEKTRVPQRGLAFFRDGATCVYNPSDNRLRRGFLRLQCCYPLPFCCILRSSRIPRRRQPAQPYQRHQNHRRVQRRFRPVGAAPCLSGLTSNAFRLLLKAKKRIENNEGGGNLDRLWIGAGGCINSLSIPGTLQQQTFVNPAPYTAWPRQGEQRESVPGSFPEGPAVLAVPR